MKKKIFSIIILLIIIISTTGCRSNSKLEDIAKKINKCESVKNYREYGFEVKATATKNKLTITKKINDSSDKVDFKLKGNILSNENLSTEGIIGMMLVIDGVGETYGYKDRELVQNMNAFPEDYQKYTLEKEGLEIILNDKKNSLKIDISKKVPLIDINKFYLKEENVDWIKKIIDEKKTGNQNGKVGNIAYDIFIDDDKSTIQIGQDEKLSDSAYKSIITILKVIYGKDTANHFQEIYPKFIDTTITAEEFTIEKDYKIEDKDKSVFKGTEIVLVTVNKKK